MLEIYSGRSKFYQWDVGQKLIVDDSILAVHYDNGTGDALVCPVYEYEGQCVADVPNIMLQTVWAIKCYAYCGECVRAEKVYEVEKRSRPDDYIYTETETLRYSMLLDMLNATNDDLTTVEHTLEASMADLAAEHTADMETVEAQLAATNADVAKNKQIADADRVKTDSRLETHWQYILENRNKIAADETAQADKNAAYDTAIGTLNATAAEHENRISNIEQNGGGTGGGVSATPDWHENNPDSPAYIKNRTHYDTYDIVEIMPETSPDELIEGEMMAVYINTIDINAGYTYKVYYNGVAYECVAIAAEEMGESGYYMLGNYDVLMGGEGTGEPFVIMATTPEMAEEIGIGVGVYLLDGATEITLKIEQIGGTVKIDKKYLDLSEYAKNDTVIDIKEKLAAEINTTAFKLKGMINKDVSQKPTIHMSGKADTGEIDIQQTKYVIIRLYATPQESDGIKIKITDNEGRAIVDATAENVFSGNGTDLWLTARYESGGRFVVMDMEKKGTSPGFAELSRYRSYITSSSSIDTFYKLQITTTSGNPIKAGNAQLFIYYRGDAI